MPSIIRQFVSAFYRGLWGTVRDEILAIVVFIAGGGYWLLHTGFRGGWSWHSFRQNGWEGLSVTVWAVSLLVSYHAIRAALEVAKADDGDELEGKSEVRRRIVTPWGEPLIAKPLPGVAWKLAAGVGIIVALCVLVSYFMWDKAQSRELAGEEPVYAEVTIPDFILTTPKAGERLTVELLMLNSSKFDINFSIRWLLDIAHKNIPPQLQSTEEQMWQYMQQHLKQPSHEGFSIQGSGGKITMPLAGEPLSASDAQELLTEQAQVYVMGTIVYKDSNGEHEREFCSYLTWPRDKHLPGLCHNRNGAVKPHDLQ